MYQQLLAGCIQRAEQAPLGTKKQAAKLINVNVASVSKVWCARTVRAFKNGRLTYAEMKRAHLGTGDRSTFIKIVQGR